MFKKTFNVGCCEPWFRSTTLYHGYICHIIWAKMPLWKSFLLQDLQTNSHHHLYTLIPYSYCLICHIVKRYQWQVSQIHIEYIFLSSWNQWSCFAKLRWIKIVLYMQPCTPCQLVTNILINNLMHCINHSYRMTQNIGYKNTLPSKWM